MAMLNPRARKIHPQPTTHPTHGLPMGGLGSPQPNPTRSRDIVLWGYLAKVVQYKGGIQVAAFRHVYHTLFVHWILDLRPPIAV
jgi:hypothetical protein